MLDFAHQYGQATITEEIVIDAVFFPLQNLHSFWKGLEWNWVILLMLHFERWMRNSGDSEGRAHLLKKETFLSQLLICLVSLLAWEEVVELISV